MPEDEAQYYEGEFRAGRTLVTVKSDTRFDEASAILRRYGAYDIQDHRTGLGATTTPATETGTNYRVGSDSRSAPPVRHEMSTGAHSGQTSIDVPIEREEIQRERRRANEFPE